MLESNTKVFIDVYKGKKIFAIWKVDAHGNKEGRFPVVSFGAFKAECIGKHQSELADFISKYSTNKATNTDPQGPQVPTDLKDVF